MRKWHYLSLICLTMLSNLAIAQSGVEEDKGSQLSSGGIIGIGVVLVIVVIIILFKNPKRKFND